MNQRIEQTQFLRIHNAFLAGDLVALRAEVGPDTIPNGPIPFAIGSCLVYAIYHSPLAFIRTLLEIGAKPNPVVDDGFPPLIAALAKSRSQVGSPARADVQEILELLLRFGADVNQRGINDYTPLHMAVGERNLRAVELLLTAGADPRVRTRIDGCETPREMAIAAGLYQIADLLLAEERRISGMTPP